MSINKNTIITILFVVLTMVVCALLSECEYSDTLKKHVDNQDSILKDGRLRDSLLIENTKEYSEVITKYVSNCGITLNNKQLSAEEIVKIISKSTEEVTSLQDSLIRAEMRSKISLYKYSDSLNLYRFLINRVKTQYGIVYTITNNTDGSRAIKSNFSKVDSALALYPFYKNKIKGDSLGNLIITYEKKNKIIQNK